MVGVIALVGGAWFRGTCSYDGDGGGGGRVGFGTVLFRTKCVDSSMGWGPSNSVVVSFARGLVLRIWEEGSRSPILGGIVN